jgi:hypothetical protein
MHGSESRFFWGSTTPSNLYNRGAIHRIGIQGCLIVGLLAGCWVPALSAWGDSEPAGGDSAEPLGRIGALSTYVLADTAESIGGRPDWESQQRLSVVAAQLQLGPVETVDQRPYQWCGLTWWRLDGQAYRLWVLLDRWPSPDRDPQVADYRWQEPAWPDALTYRRDDNGELLLPRLDLWRYGWPQSEAGPKVDQPRTPVDGLLERIWLHGWLFERLDDGIDAAAVLQQRLEADALAAIAIEPVTMVPPAEVTEVRLQPDLLIGWTPMDRDAAGRPYYRIPSQAYEYVAKTAEDMEADRDSGANFFVAHPRRGEDSLPPWLERSSMYHNNLAKRPLDWPVQLYRSNYWGYGNHIDEPGVHNWGLGLRSEPDAPPPLLQAVASLQKSVRRGVESRGQRAIGGQIAKLFDLGQMELREGPETIVSWEYEWSTAWYQLAVPDGVGGIVDEDVASNELVEAYNMAFGTEIPPTVENAVALRVAVLRGAARNFDKRWGVAFYHPNEVKLKSTTIPLLYRLGASYFWAWSGWVGITDNSGLPHPYQRYYNSLVRTAYLSQPERDMSGLLRAAKVAVVLPYGYTFTPYHMHRLPWLHLEKENSEGVRYRHVLSQAAHEVERLLRLGIEFDIAIDDPLFQPDGYRELIYAQEDGRLRIERPGETVLWLDEPRPSDRPDLGPGPRLWLERIEAEGDRPGEIRFRAVGRLGTGDWAGEQPHARVSWEVYGPDDLVSPAVFPEFGSERSLRVDPEASVTLSHPIPQAVRPKMADSDAPRPGRYVIRAAMADLFGRPAITYQTVEVE